MLAEYRGVCKVCVSAYIRCIIGTTRLSKGDCIHRSIGYIGRAACREPGPSEAGGAIALRSFQASKRRQQSKVTQATRNVNNLGEEVETEKHLTPQSPKAKASEL